MGKAAAILLLHALTGLLASAEAWKEVRFTPARIALPNPSSSQRFVISAIDAGGKVSDVTRLARVILSDASVAVVESAEGVLRGKAPGRTTLKITLGEVSAVAEVSVGNQSPRVDVRFSPDVVSILTIKGCNSSGCHGSPAGQNGFKLSLFGYDVNADHEMITKKHDGRRLNLQKPEDSLLLKKPSFEIPHGGGRLLTRGSAEYETLLEWLKQGAKLESSGVRLTALEIYPEERYLAAGSAQRLAVIGRLSDGTTRDMTQEVRYAVGDESVAKVTPSGLLTAGSRGLTAVVARGMGMVAAAQIGVVSDSKLAAPLALRSTNFIDELVFAKLRNMNVQPAPLSSDHEFVRRVYLDAIGRLPTIDEADTFLNDPAENKRAKLIDRLLDQPEYASFWTVKFEDWFRNNQLNSQGRSMGRFKEWIHGALSEDRPYDQFVKEILTSEGDTFQQPAANFWHPAADFMLKKFDVNKVTPTVTRLFLGIRLECAECHNHPLENFTQDDFYGVSAFFAQMKVKHGYGEYRRTWYRDDEGEVLHPVTKQPVAPKYLGGDRPRMPVGADRRQPLAEWIASQRNTYFARATVNRIWHQYMTVGIVEPFDDFRSTNPPTNRELLDGLAGYFVDSGFRLKALHRIILNSTTYQLSSRTGSKQEASDALERLLFARYQPRRLPAEVLLDAVSQITAVPHTFGNYPKGTRAMNIDVPDSPDYFLVAFGLPRRDVLADRSKSPTLGQALHMMNGSTVMEKLRARDNILDALITSGRNDDEIATALYRASYMRPPSAAELDNVRQYLGSEQQAGRTRRRALEGFLWSILNSKEFQLNH